jgi:hypothetical protein
MCSIKNVYPTSLIAGVRDQDQFSQKMVKCDRRQSHICFRLIGCFSFYFLKKMENLGGFSEFFKCEAAI